MHPVIDSRYAMLFSQQLLWNHSFSLEAGMLPVPPSERGGDFPYQLVPVGERFYHFYPPGNDILAMPFVALANAFGVSALDQNGRHDERDERRIQRGLASLLMAILSVSIFFTSRLLLSFRWSLLIAVAPPSARKFGVPPHARSGHTPGEF